jgi:hypothetical protein
MTNKNSFEKYQEGYRKAQNIMLISNQVIQLENFLSIEIVYLTTIMSKKEKNCKFP